MANLDRLRPDAWADKLARAANCRLVFLNSLYEEARIAEARCQECEWLLTQTQDSDIGLKLVRAKLEEHYKTKESLLLQVKELDQELMRITIQLSSIED